MTTGKKAWLALGILAVLSGGYGAQAETINGGNATSANEDVTDKVVEISSGTYAGASIRGGNVDGGTETYHGKVQNNKIVISGGTFTGANVIVGGRNKGDGITSSNIISVNGLSGNANFECFDGGMAKSGDSKGNAVNIFGSELHVNSYINGGSSETGSVLENSVSIESSSLEANYIRGGYEGAGSNSTALVQKNSVLLKDVNGTINNAVTGGFAVGIEATQNVVTIEGSKLDGNGQISGGWSNKGAATSNNVSILSNSSVQSVYGGLSGANGNVNSNLVTIDGSSAQNIYGGQSESGSVSLNKVSIMNGSNALDSIYGGKSGGNGEVSSNTVIVDTSATKHFIYGGYGTDGKIVNNTVELKNGSTAVSPIYGGYAYGNGNVEGNEVTISGSTTKDIIAGLSSGNGDVTKNTIILDNATVEGVVRGGDSQGGDVTGNIVYVKNGGDLTAARLKGGKSGNSKATVKENKIVIEDGAAWKDNTLQVGDIGELNNGSLEFEKVSLNSDQFTVRSLQTNGSYLGKTMIKINSFDVSGTDLAANSDFQKTIKFENMNFTNTSNNSQQVDISDLTSSEGKDVIGIDYGGDGTPNGVRVYAFENIQEKHTTFWGNTDTEHTVTITGDVKKSVLAGLYTDNNGNTVGNGTLKLGDKGIQSTNQSMIAGAYSDGSSNATGGKVIIDSGFKSTTDQTVHGGYSVSGDATDNSVSLTGVSNGKLSLIGGFGNKVSGNTLSVTGKNSVNSISKFDKISFNDVKLDSTMLEVADTAGLADVNDYDVNISTDQTLTVGGSATLVKTKDGTYQNYVGTQKDFMQGAGLAISGSLSKSEDGNNLVANIVSIKASSNANDVAASHVTALGFLNEGSDLVLTGIGSLAEDDAYGIQTFAATERSDSSYDGGTDIDGWKVIAGVGAQDKVSSGALAWGVFAERGLGSYTTSVDHGSGDVEYNGGGAALRYTKDNGVYAEASIRLGKLHDDVDGVLGGYDYDTSADYKAFHAGVGKLIPSGSGTWDVYGKYFYTKADDVGFTVNNQYYGLGSIESQRIRLGARYSRQANSHLGIYYGAAWEYEFDGDANGSVAGYALDTASLGGSTFLGEVGLTYKPQADSRWDFEVGVKGYGGERDGMSGVLRGAYHF